MWRPCRPRTEAKNPRRAALKGLTARDRIQKQIIKVLKEHAAGLSAADVCRKHGISDAVNRRVVPMPIGAGVHPWERDKSIR